LRFSRVCGIISLVVHYRVAILVVFEMREEGYMKFLVTLKEGRDGHILAECPSLPGCVTQGTTREEALRNIKEAIELNIETRDRFKLPPQYEVAEIEVAV